MYENQSIIENNEEMITNLRQKQHIDETKKVTKKICPSGFKEDGDTCKKETTVNCTKEN